MQKLAEIYLDKDGQRDAEYRRLTSDPDMVKFYAELRALRDYHNRIGKKVLKGAEVTAEEVNAHEELEFEIKFSQAENSGKFLDMYDLYQEFLSLPIYRAKLKGGFSVPPNLELQSSVMAAPSTTTFSDDLESAALGLPVPSTAKTERPEHGDEKPEKSEALSAGSKRWSIKKEDDSSDRSGSSGKESGESSSTQNGESKTTFQAQEVHPIDYLLYLSLFDDYPLLITRNDKLSAPKQELQRYYEHLTRVKAYLARFHSLLHPMVNVEELEKICLDDFKERYESGKLVGWHSGPDVVSDRPAPPERPSTWNSYQSALNKLQRTVEQARKAHQAEQKAAAKAAKAAKGATQKASNPDEPQRGTPAVKQEDTMGTGETKSSGQVIDTESPLYCKACARMFANTAVFTHHLTGKKHIRAEEELKSKAHHSTSTSNSQPKDNIAAGQKKGGSTSSSADPEDDASQQSVVVPKNLPAIMRPILEMEYLIGAYADLLRVQIMSTRAFVEKKHTKSYRELLADLEAMNEEDDAELARKFDALINQENEVSSSPTIYNPLNLPLDWDGKPIPVWLYKLHGLNIKYECEICCGAVYRGQRDFYKHFTEWRHQHAMKQLGLPNTPHFMHITRVDDAKALLKKLQQDQAATEFNPLAEEEIETESGQVLVKGAALAAGMKL